MGNHDQQRQGPAIAVDDVVAGAFDTVTEEEAEAEIVMSDTASEDVTPSIRDAAGKAADMLRRLRGQ